ncbi:MAG: hypothetical protein EBS07_12890, partial [Sphingobacteriia bacterium]|nr:hypothetical protein [Sphingobacteriia bacterium]
MFSLLVSLRAIAQPGEPVTPCQETFQIPISYSLRTLPCHSSDPLSKEFIISLGPGSGSQYVVSDPSNQSTITGPTINNGVYTYKISFDATGWRRLVITTNKECFETTILDVPVLCECPSLPYKVLGNLTQNETKVTGSDLSGVANFYIINNIILNDFIDIHIEGQSFTVLGKNEYNRSTPGGNIFGPWIFIGKYLPIYSAVYCGSNNGDLTTFKGDPCFGMWGGINVPFPAINAQTLRMENTLIRDAYRAVGLTMGISGVAEIENCSFFSNLYGIVSKH